MNIPNLILASWFLIFSQYKHSQVKLNSYIKNKAGTSEKNYITSDLSRTVPM